MKDPRYVTVFGACLTQFTVIGLLFSYGIFFKAFETEFGWSRTLLSACSALAFFMMGTLAMLAGRLNDRFGPRVVLSVTGVLYGLGFVLVSRVEAPWQMFVIFGTFIALGLSTHDVVTLSTVARWFEKRRGVMSGVVKVGTAAGQVALPPIAALLIAGYGWRAALVILGAGASVLLLIAAQSMRRPPVPAQASPEGTGASFAEARGTRLFWTLCAIQLAFFPVLTSVPLHVAVHGMDLGMSAGAAAGLLSVIGGASVAGRLVVGAASDRIGGKNAYLLCLSCLLVSLLALNLTGAAGALYLVMAVYGFAHGGLFTVVSPAVAEAFGMRAHGAIFGVVLFFGTIGGSVVPILVGWSFDATGSYSIAFAGLAGLAAAALGLVLSLPGRGRLAVG
ncbi:MAG: MFS transporter [Paracoccaceae bacterium]|nr:MFS transporter [Paracoccaceae bacterium]